MTRSRFFAGLLAMVGIGMARIVKGQSPVCMSSSSDPDFCEKERIRRLEQQETGFERMRRLVVLPWQNTKPKNGQCPVCGTQAKPWKIENGMITDSHSHAFGTRELIRCAHCSNAFWQDAETGR